MTDLTSARAAWESFYVIVGSSGGALIGLLLIGIHNAWDTVTHIVVSGPAERTSGG